MFFTTTDPMHQSDRIYLYPRPEAALHGLNDGRSVFGVAVEFDLRSRKVTPLWVDRESFDPAWTTPAEPHADGSVTAKAPIPEPLFTALVACDEWEGATSEV